jgi:O-ureido-D-serine cyclo-ligase
VRKSPRFEGDDESVSTTAVEITAAEAALARTVLANVDGPLLYARVDVAPGPDGQPLLMELELVEPSLFFPQCPTALDRFVSGVRRRLDALGSSRPPTR